MVPQKIRETFVPLKLKLKKSVMIDNFYPILKYDWDRSDQLIDMFIKDPLNYNETDPMYCSVDFLHIWFWKKKFRGFLTHKSHFSFYYM